MDEDNVNLNETTFSGIINSICENDLDKEYIKFGMTLKKYSKKIENVYISLNIKSDLYNIYKDLFFKDNFIYIKGYHNSYVDKFKNIKPFITVTEVYKSYEDMKKKNSFPYIRTDVDGVEVWNGKRCESQTWDFNNPEDLKLYNKLEECLSEFK